MEEAEEILERRVEAEKSRGADRLEVIVGKGLHSEGRVLKLGRAVENVVGRSGTRWEVDPENAGRGWMRGATHSITGHRRSIISGRNSRRNIIGYRNSSMDHRRTRGLCMTGGRMVNSSSNSRVRRGRLRKRSGRRLRGSWRSVVLCSSGVLRKRLQGSRRNVVLCGSGVLGSILRVNWRSAVMFWKGVPVVWILYHDICL
jgi:hypothetical protein